MFDGQDGQIGIADEGALDVPAQPDKDIPVLAAGRDQHGTRPVDKMLTERGRGLHRGGGIENPGVRDDPEEAGQDDLGQRERFVRLGQRPEPRRVATVLGRVLTVRVDEDVDIQELHDLPAAREALDIVGFEQRRCLVDIGTGEPAAGSERHQVEAVPWGSGRGPKAQADGVLDQAADGGTRLGGTLLELRKKPLVHRDRRTHDA